MRRTLTFLLAMSLLIAACGGGAETTSTSGSATDSTSPETAATDAPVGSTIDDSEEASSTTEGTADQPPTTPAVTDFDGPVAADFSIDLNAGGTFTLSEETRPVYMVFWAEW